MKFDFIIGNPPYQEETTQKESSSNGQKPKRNIFHHFQMQADELADIMTVLIYPAKRWIHRSGKGMNNFGLQQINDPCLSKLIYYADANEVFQGVAIADGLSIVIKNHRKTSSGFNYTYVNGPHKVEVFLDNPGDQLIPLDPRDLSITSKISNFVSDNDIDFLHDHILSRSLFGIESEFIENNPGIAREMTVDSKIDYTKEIKLFTNDKAGKSGRAKWFIAPRNVVPINEALINEWQVVVSSANAGGQKRDNQIEIIDNYSAFGRARVALRSFKTKLEAENFYKYCKTYIIRYAFLLTDEALTSLGKKVPDILDYPYTNRFLDFSRDLDDQLYNILNLTSEEILYIKSRVESVRNKT